MRALLDHPAHSTVAVISRTPTQNLFPNVTYHACDISSHSALLTILEIIKPHMIITTASPLVSNLSHQESTTVIGTKNILACASSTPSVRHLIYCSSTTVIGGAPFTLLTEGQAHLLGPTDRSDAYSAAKARADALVLASNNPHPTDGSNPLRTAVLRPCGIVGEGDSTILPAMLATLDEGSQGIEIGPNKTKFDFVYAGNVADAHVQLALAMVREAEDQSGTAPKVAGEAFFITNGQPMMFWDFVRLVWRAAGDETRLESVWVIPMWLARAMAVVTEKIVWAISFGRRKPLKFTTATMDNLSTEKTFSIEKARERFGYVPKVSLEEGVRKGVQNLRENRKSK